LVTLRPVRLTNGVAIGIEVELPRTHLAIVAAPRGYIMCGALDVRLLDERLAERAVVAGRAVGVTTVDELLAAPLESVTRAMAALGIAPGDSGRSAVERLF
jgi:uncharacterized protein YunC (DUF1805 family)